VLDIRAQTRAVLQNIGDISRQCGRELADVVEVSTYLVNMPTSTLSNEVYSEFSAIRVRRVPPWQWRSCRTRCC